MNESPHIVFAGGGTAGHLFPGLAVAERLKQADPNMRITFVGTGRAFEDDHVGAGGFEYKALPCRPFPRHASDTLRFLADNLSGYYAARRFLRNSKAGLVIGLGGYASAATGRAAAALRIPYLLLEQNAVPGLATRWLAPRAAMVCAAFDSVRSGLRQNTRLQITGTPVRRAFVTAERDPFENHPLRLLVLGGSGGSRTLNEAVPRAIYKAGKLLAGWEILHQTGDRDTRATSVLYSKLGLRARVAPFFDDLPRWLSCTDLAICRAGGSTLAELAVCAVPSILLPWSKSADDHQLKNAQWFAAREAARLVDDRQVEGRLDNAIAAHLTALVGDEALRRQMGQNARRLARVQAAEIVARLSMATMNERSAAAVA